MARKFVYSPGLPGYGTKGVDGSAGLTGVATWFSSYDGASDTVTIKSKIIANKELFSNDEFIPGYPTRKYQNGDIIIDRNARIYQIDFNEANLYKDTGIFLNTSGFFSAGPIQALSPNFERYSNQFETQKYLIDSVYSNDVGDYTTFPASIYDLPPVYYGRVDFVDQNLSPDFQALSSDYYPFNVWTIGTSDPNGKDAISLVRSIDENLWRFGNFNSGSVRDVSLSLDFSETYIQGPTHIGGDIYVDGSIIGGIDFTNIECTTLNSAADISVGGDLYVNDELRFYSGVPQTIRSSNALSIYTDTNLLLATNNQSSSNVGSIYLQPGDQTGSGAYSSGDLVFDTGDGADYIGGLSAGDWTFEGGAGGNATSSSGINYGGKGGSIEFIAGQSGFSYGNAPFAGRIGGTISLKGGLGGNAEDTADVEIGGPGGDVSIAGGPGWRQSGTANTYGGGHGGHVYIDGGHGGDGIASDGAGGIVYINGGRNFTNSTQNTIYMQDYGGTIILSNLSSATAAGRILAGPSGGTSYGEEGRPTYSFQGESDTGFWRSAQERVSLSTGGDENFRWDGNDFYADGNIIAYSTVFSDIRLKENIKGLENPLDFVLKLRGISYDLKKTKESHYGYIAQEVEELDPKLILEKNKIGEADETLYKSIKYSEIIPFLSEAIKEQQKIIDNQQEQINDLINEIKEIKNKIL